MSLTNYGRNLHAAVLTGQDTMPAQWYLMLLLSLPTATESMATTSAREPTAVDYERILIDLGSDSWSTPVNGITYLSDTIEITPENDWGALVGWGLATAATSGTLYKFGSLDAPISARAGSTLVLNGYPRIEVQ